MLLTPEHKRKLARKILLSSCRDIDEWDTTKEGAYTADAETLRKFDAEVALPERVKIWPSKFVEYAFYIPDSVSNRLEPFSFAERPYLRRIYDTASRRTLLLCARQVEKTVVLSSLVPMADGRLVEAKDVQVGDMVSSYAKEDNRIRESRVLWKSAIYRKPCYRVRTRQGHVAEVGEEHPIRRLADWMPARDLSVRERVCVARRSGVFGNEDVEEDRVALTALVLGDGHIADTSVSLTGLPGSVIEDFLRRTAEEGPSIYPKKGTRAVDVRLRRGRLWNWLNEDGLVGALSHNKFIPDWVFRLDQHLTALFINRLWSTDGCCKIASPTHYEFVYASTSKLLCRQVQSLLWKFGIPSRIRENHPTFTASDGSKQRGRVAYLLRVETCAGINTFLREIGALGKTEGLAPLPDVGNNNRDTLPKELGQEIKSLLADRVGEGLYGPNATNSLRSKGLRELPEYALTFEKLAYYIESMRADNRCDQRRVDALEKYLSRDVYWDQVVEVVPIGERDCVDFEIEGTHSFLVDGIVTHNSTSLGNRIISYCAVQNNFKAMYISPTQPQARTFSRDRITKPLRDSETLSKWLSKQLTDSVSVKQFVNGSIIEMLYAFLTADRIRGHVADLIAIDELQDILLDNIPVIEESASHSPWKIFCYSGTPKSLDNTIEWYWSTQSTQCEWSVPCDCGVRSIGGRYWNIMGVDNIGKKGPICDRCGKLLDLAHVDAQWVAKVPHPSVPVPYEGYRIPQMIVPWIAGTPAGWKDFLHKFKTYSTSKFNNEVMGISYDSGTRPLTRDDVIRNCDPALSMHPDMLADIMRRLQNYPIYAGIDWGPGERASYTLLSLGAYFPGDTKFTIFYVKRFEGRESGPTVMLPLLFRILKTWNPTIIAADYGQGWVTNDELVREFGAQRVFKYQYAEPKVKVSWIPELRRYVVRRMEVMADIFSAIKRGDTFRYPRWEEFQTPFGQDMLNIFSEYSEPRKMTVFSKHPEATDDAFHSCLYCFLGSMLHRPRPDIMAIG